MKLKSLLIIPDSHSYNVDVPAWGAMIAYAKSRRWDYIVHLGDLLEGDSISDHNVGKPGLIEGARLEKDFSYARLLLDELLEATRKPKTFLLKGNHEYRVDRFLERTPQLKGLISVEKGLKLHEKGISLVDCYPGGKVLRLGKLCFTHGLYTGANPCKKHLEVFGCNIVFGHTHEVGIYTKTTFGKGKPLAAFNLGCLCRLDMPYLEGRPTNWQHAFGSAYIQPSGDFNLYIHSIVKGKVIVDGKVYQKVKEAA